MVRWTDKKTTQETQDKRVLSGGSKKGLTAVHLPGTRGLSPSGTSERPSPRPGPSTDIRGASQVPGWARPSPKTEFWRAGRRVQTTRNTSPVPLKLCVSFQPSDHESLGSKGFLCFRPSDSPPSSLISQLDSHSTHLYPTFLLSPGCAPD